MSLVETVNYINAKEMEENEASIQGGFGPLPALSHEAQTAVRPFIEFCATNRVRALPAKVAVVGSWIESETDNRRSHREILDSLSGISALHHSAGVGDPVPQAVTMTTLAGAPIDPPRSWRADEKQEFLRLPIHTQWIIQRREIDREIALRRKQNELAEAIKATRRTTEPISNLVENTKDETMAKNTDPNSPKNDDWNPRFDRTKDYTPYKKPVDISKKVDEAHSGLADKLPKGE